MSWRTTHSRYPVPDWLANDPRFQDETDAGDPDVSFISDEPLAVDLDDRGEAVRDLYVEVVVDRESPYYYVWIRELRLLELEPFDEIHSAVTTDDPDVARKVVEWLFANIKSGDFVEQYFPDGPIRHLFAEDGTPLFSVPSSPLNDPELLGKINRYRAAAGQLRALKPGEWSDQDLREFLSHAPTPYHNPQDVAVLTRRLKQ